ncbi:MAG TPA: hypothetical protein VJ672_12695 [Gemmatimonadaceae bacterium]|nr:hypothetical protein [Gemmatimonadaceae bacterium]
MLVSHAAVRVIHGRFFCRSAKPVTPSMHLIRWTKRALYALALAAGSVYGASAHAQAIIGIGDDAIGVPRGRVRLTIEGAFSRHDRVFDIDGNSVPFGAEFARDSLGADALEPLRPIESALRSLSGLPDARVTLGRSVATFSSRIATTRFALEAGVTNRLTIGAMLPIVQTRVTPFINVNPNAIGGNISLNPATTDAAIQLQNQQFFQQFLAAQAQLGSLITDCLAGSADPRCPNALAQGPALQAAAIPFGTQLQSVFGSMFVPLVGTQTDLAMRARLTSFANTYNSLLGSSVITHPGPIGASRTFSTNDFQDLVSSADFAFRPLLQIRREGIGDIELGGQFLLINTLPGDRRLRPTGAGVRLAVGGLVRLGTGSPESPDDLADIGTGDGQTDVEARAVTDLVLGRRAWISIGGRYGWQMKDELPMRISPRDEPFAPLYTRRTVSRDLGDYIELEATPRFVLSRYFMLGGQYVYRRKAEDKHTGTFAVTNLAGDNVTLDAGVLDVGTEEVAHRVTGGVVFSTVAAYRERRARWPIEISFRHTETLAGSGGFVPKTVVESIQARLYVRLFGPDDRPRAAAAPR